MIFMNSPILIIYPQKPPITHLEFEWFPSIDVALKSQQIHKYDIIALNLDCFFSDQYKSLFQKSDSVLHIIELPLDTPVDSLIQLQRTQNYFAFTESFFKEPFEELLFKALESSAQNKQNQEWKKLLEEQNTHLTQLNKELELRIEKRQSYLIEVRRNLFITNEKLELLKITLEAIFKSPSISEIETHLNHILGSKLQLSWVKIILQGDAEKLNSNKELQTHFSVYKTSLLSDQQQIGYLTFLRPKGFEFLIEEKQFLDQITEAVSLSSARFNKKKQTELTKEEWESTFNSISDPLALISEDYKIIQFNEAYKKQSLALHKSSEQQDSSHQSLICYKVLFNRSEPCTECQLGKSFKKMGSHEHQSLQVFSQNISGLFSDSQKKIYVNLYRDITQKLKMEKQILETTKMAEMGTIGSSIAHELNNPLGGMLSFLQLIKMDLPQTDIHYKDIEEMESAVLRSKEIIENLLGFARNPHENESREIFLKESLEKALKIIEIQILSLGIEIHKDFEKSELKIFANPALLVQALKNMIQVSIDSYSDKNRHEKLFKEIIEIRFQENTKNNFWQIEIKDSGSYPKEWFEIFSPNTLLYDNLKNQNLDSIQTLPLTLSIATQILFDHQILIELKASPTAPFNQWTLKKLS